MKCNYKLKELLSNIEAYACEPYDDFNHRCMEELVDIGKVGYAVSLGMYYIYYYGKFDHRYDIDIKSESLTDIIMRIKKYFKDMFKFDVAINQDMVKTLEEARASMIIS